MKKTDVTMVNEDDKPHACVATLDGSAHVIPISVFSKIILGEMKITDMDDWEIVVRTVLSEWLRAKMGPDAPRFFKD